MVRNGQRAVNDSFMDEQNENIFSLPEQPKERLTLTRDEFLRAIDALLGAKSKLSRALREMALTTDEEGYLTRETFGNIFSLTVAWVTGAPEGNTRIVYQAFLDYLKMHYPRREDAK